MSYQVQQGESINDVVINATGTLANLNQVLSDNSFSDWNPDLQAGQEIIISDLVTMDSNALLQLNQYPVCNNVSEGIYAQIESIFEELSNLWILSTGFWNDDAPWNDSKTWID